MKNKIIFKTLMLKGEAGSTIVSMEKTGHVGTADIYTITFNDGSTTEISLENMSAITSVEKTSSTDTEDIYTITCADGSTQTFSVLNHNADIAAMSDDIDTIDARVDNFINSVVPNTVETLWTGSIKDVGDSATLSKAVSNFDYIDLYLLGSADSKYIRVPATQTAVQIQQQNLSDDASSNFLRLWEMGVSISGSTVSITKLIAWAWDDPNNSNPTVTANAQNGVPITRIDGVKVASDTPAELTDIRVGAGGRTYNSAGAAVRGQITDVLSKQYVDAYKGTVSGTRQVNVTGLSIPAGTYVFKADSVVSSDTDDSTCRVIFVKNDTTVTNVYASRTSNYSTTVTLTDDVDEIRFFAANSYNNGTGDTFTFTNIEIYADTELNIKLSASMKYNGRSNDVSLADANNADKNSVYSIANGTTITNLPSFSTEGILITSGGTYPVQLFFVDGVFYKRYYRGSSNGWTPWVTTSGLEFKGRSNSVGLTDANDATKNSVYNTAGTVNMANLPYSANEGVLITTGGDFPVQLYFVNECFYKRYYRGASNGWSTWVNTGAIIDVTPSTLIDSIKKYNGTGATLYLSDETYDIISIYKAYYGNDWFDNYVGWNGQTDYFTRGLYLTGIKLKGRTNTKFVMSADTGNTAVKTHFSILAPYTDVTLEDFTIDIGNGYCRYCIHDDYAPQNCKMVYKNLVLKGSSYNADALYGMGCGSNVIYEFENCWFISGTNRAFYAHSAPNQTAPCIVKIKNCTTYQNVGFKYYSDYAGMNLAYVDKSVQNVTCDAYYDAQTVNFNVYHDTGSAIELLPTA